MAGLDAAAGLVARPEAKCHAPLGWLADAAEAALFAAYFEAGRPAVARAVALGQLSPDTDPLCGYSVPMGKGANAHKLGLLRASHGRRR